MDIIYLWNLNLKEQYGCGVSLSGKYDIQFSEKENCLKIKKKKNYVRNFWGQNVVDCFAVVGENGSGKTRLVNSIMYSIRKKKDCNFVRVLQGISDEFVIGLRNENLENKKVITNQIEELYLEELYNGHKNYVMDIIKSKYINSEEYIRELLRMFPMLFNSEDEVKSLLYMTNITKKNWGNRPLAKLTHDIDIQLDEDVIREE